MMKRISLLVLLAGLSYGQVTNVIATKSVAPFWVVPSATMPLSGYNYSKVWLTAKSPIISGGSNYVCFAKFCEGNLYSTPSNSIPVIVEIEGVRSLYFDGLDDYLRAIVLSHSTNQISFMVKFKSDGATNPFLLDKNYFSSFYCQLITSTKQIEFGGKAVAGSTFTTATNSYSTGVVQVVVATLNSDTDTASLYLNGNQIFNSTNFTGAIGINSSALTIGAKHDLSTGRFKGHIYDIQVFSGIALTSNQVRSISQ
jgi:hypothetical protein